MRSNPVRYGIATLAVRTAWIVLTVAIVLFTVNLSYHSASTWQALFEGQTGVLCLLVTAWIAIRLKQWVEHRYQRDIHDGERILSDLSHSIAGIRDTKALLNIVGRCLVEALHAEPIAILLDKGRGYELAYSSRSGLPPSTIKNTSPVLRHLQRLQGPAKSDSDDPQSWVNGLPEADRNMLTAVDCKVVVPMTVDRRIVGIMTVGPKRWDMPWARADLQLLMAAGSQTALALENSRLTDDIRAEIAERERVNRELEIAREVQQRLFPQSLPQVQGLDFAGYCRPALGVGGDYYDFIRLDNGSLGIAVGDVSGKGIAAALMMASLQASLRGQTITMCTSVAEMIERINRLVFEASAENRYATFFYAAYDPSTYTLRYVNAGHNPPILLRKGESSTCVHRLEEGGTVIGMFPGSPYREETLELLRGDILIAFTDGITEALNDHEAEFGEQSLIDSVLLQDSRSAADIISAILKRVDSFTLGTPQHDDMTLVTVRVC
jgi:sigma-B regulation protein RsbU (phosphoserine phosphatase)